MQLNLMAVTCGTHHSVTNGCGDTVSHRRGLRHASGYCCYSSSPRIVCVTRTDVDYERILEAARQCTFNHPGGQTYGRAGRRCVLEDGERSLMRCIDLQPEDPRGWLLMAQNLTRQNRGREQEVPSIVMDGLRCSRLRGCRAGSEEACIALEAIQLAIDALTTNGGLPVIPKFCSDAILEAPALEDAVRAMQRGAVQGVTNDVHQGATAAGSTDD